jgi:photosystem II stability/assembly factor-like uncharacterized protein
MSFYQSNISSGNYVTSLTGVEGIASHYNTLTSQGELYYSSDSGATWVLTKNISASDPGFIISLSATGTTGLLNGIAAGFDANNYPIVYYTIDSGKNWNSSTSGLPGLSTTKINNIFVSVSELKGVIAVETEDSNVLLYYSIDGGNNWSQSINDTAIPTPFIENGSIQNAAICLDGIIVRYIFTLINSSGDLDIYTSINGGANISNVLTLTNFNTYSTALSISGSIALLGGDSGVYISNDGGLNWLISINNTENTLFKSVSIDVAVGMVAALNTENLTCSIYNTTNSGVSWNTQVLSITDVRDIVQIKVSGTIGYLALKTTLSSINLLYKTIDSGANWKFNNNLNIVNINDISLSGNNSIIGTSSGIYYNICASSYCYNYTYNKNGQFIFQRGIAIYLNYNNVIRYQYNRYVPNYFRKYYEECGFNNYEEALMNTNLPLSPLSICLRKQLRWSPINLYSLEEIFIRIVPSINDSPELTIYKDNIRNEFFAFALNIEKSYLYFNIGRETCNNNLIPWNAVFNVEPIQGQDFDKGTTFSYTYGKNVPLSQYDQYIIYNLSVNYFNIYFSNLNNRFRLNYYNIIRLALGLPIVGELTIVDFYNLIYFTYIFLNKLFTISQTLLLGKDPGIPKQFLDLYFPFHRQKYYYNLYLSWIVSRNKYLGFGGSVNTSNGSGTNIQVPGKFTN